MEITGRLPNDAILHPIDKSLDESNPRQSRLLSDNELSYLKLCYHDILPSYKNMCQRYEEERKRTQIYHRLRQFPTTCNWTPTSGPQLTASEQEMRTISNEIQLLDRFTHKDSFGRKLVFTCMSSDTKSTKSSYVYVKQTNGSYLFGRIKFIFSHII